MQAYFISRKGYQEGPHSLELIEDKIKKGYLSSKDYIYDSKTGEWLWLSQYKQTREYFENSEVTVELEPSAPNNNWYLLKEQSQLGPYDYQEIIDMLFDKKVFEYDYVWTTGMDAWQRISECIHFEEKKLKTLIKSKNGKNPSHFRRRNARINHSVSLVFHNHKKLWNANNFELSSSGASIQVESQNFNKGELLLLHYRPSKKVPAFNVQCEVISCQKASLNKSNLYRIGLRFIKINYLAQKAISEIVHNQNKVA